MLLKRLCLPFLLLAMVTVVLGGAAKLTPEACVVITVTAPDGSPFVGRLRMRLRVPGDSQVVGGGFITCDSRGIGSRAGLRPGEYDAEFTALDGEAESSHRIRLRLMSGESEILIQLK